MQVKRTTYATRAGDDEIAKVSLEIKQIIKQLQNDLKKKKKKKKTRFYMNMLKLYKASKENIKQFTRKKLN